MVIETHTPFLYQHIINTSQVCRHHILSSSVKHPSHRVVVICNHQIKPRPGSRVFRPMRAQMTHGRISPAYIPQPCGRILKVFLQYQAVVGFSQNSCTNWIHLILVSSTQPHFITWLNKQTDVSLLHKSTVSSQGWWRKQSLEEFTMMSNEYCINLNMKCIKQVQFSGHSFPDWNNVGDVRRWSYAICNIPPSAAALATSSPSPNCVISGPNWPDCSAALKEVRAWNIQRRVTLNLFHLGF